MSPHCRDHWKQKGPTATALIRFLHRRVGTQWNAVFSDVCGVTDRRSFARACEIRLMLRRLVGTGIGMPFVIAEGLNLRAQALEVRILMGGFLADELRRRRRQDPPATFVKEAS